MLKAGFNVVEFAEFTMYNICQIFDAELLVVYFMSYHSKTSLHRNQDQARLRFAKLLFNKRNNKRFNNHG